MNWTPYETRFPPEECLRRIESATEPDRLFSDMRMSQGVLARIGDERFRLRLRHAYVRNSFSRVLLARLRQTSAGSVIEVRTGLKPAVLLFSITWFAGVVLIGGLMMLVGVLQLLGAMERADVNPWVAVLGPPALLAFGVLLTRTGRGDALELLQFMERVLEARPCPPGGLTRA